MIPVLFDAKATTFNTMGIGPLTDAISCIVTEERNGMFELEMQYPVSGARFKDLKTDRIILAKASRSSIRAAQAFRIYLVSKPLSGKIKVYARHISYQLSHIIVGPIKTLVPATFMQRLLLYSVGTNPFIFTTDITTSYTDPDVPTPAQPDPNAPSGDIVDDRDFDYGYRSEWYKTVKESLLGEEGSFLDIWGGEFEWDNYNVHAWAHRGSDKGVTFEYGVDIIDMTHETDIGELVTGIFPYYRKETYEKLTDEQVSDIYAGSGQDFLPVGEDESWRTTKKVISVTLTNKIINTSNANKFSYPRIILLDLTDQFDSTPTKKQLKTLAEAYLTAYGVKQINNEIEVVSQDKDVELCDTVHVSNQYLNVTFDAKVIKTEYDTLNEKYNKIEIADVADLDE